MAYRAYFECFVLFSLIDLALKELKRFVLDLTWEELERAQGQRKKLEEIDHDAQRLRRRAQLSLVRFCPVFINPRSSNILPHIISDAWTCLEESCPSLLECEPVCLFRLSYMNFENRHSTFFVKTQQYHYLFLFKVTRRSHAPSSREAMDSISWQVI